MTLLIKNNLQEILEEWYSFNVWLNRRPRFAHVSACSLKIVHVVSGKPLYSELQVRQIIFGINIKLALTLEPPERVSRTPLHHGFQLILLRTTILMPYKPTAK